jgi:predicted glycoside hydrolase/deacetylase ChbG (UPF0249 family)
VGEMSPNRALRELGFGPRDRVVVVHADDLGMCQATIDAFLELADTGLVSSASLMVPCPWFQEAAARCLARRDLDLGVHLTLTSEWTGYRWGPISTRDATSGLIDDDGCFHASHAVWGSIDRDAARGEIHAQLDRAVGAGIDVTHIDSHMFALLHGSLADDYVELGLARRTPILLTRGRAWVDALSRPRIDALEEQGLPVFDLVRQVYIDAPGPGALSLAKQTFEALPLGLTYLILHPALDTPELRAITSDWAHRVADLEAFRDPALARHVRELGIEVIGWKPLRDLMRGSSSR